MGRRKLAPPVGTYHYDVRRYYCVTYSVAGVGNEKCVLVYDYDYMNQAQLSAVNPSPSDRANYTAVVSCYNASVPGQALPECWPR